MCSCNGNTVELLIGADFLKLLFLYNYEKKMEFFKKYPNYEYGGKLEHTKIPEHKLKFYMDKLKDYVRNTDWTSYEDVNNLLLKFDNFSKNQVPKLNFKNLITPTWNICSKCYLPKYLALIDNQLCEKSNYYKQVIYTYNNRNIIHNFDFSMHEGNPCNFSKQDKIMDYIIILKNKFNNFQKLKMLMIFKFNTLVSHKIFNFIGNLYLIKFNQKNEKYIDWLENQMNYLKDKYE